MLYADFEHIIIHTSSSMLESNHLNNVVFVFKSFILMPAFEIGVVYPLEEDRGKYLA